MAHYVIFTKVVTLTLTLIRFQTKKFGTIGPVVWPVDRDSGDLDLDLDLDQIFQSKYVPRSQDLNIFAVKNQDDPTSGVTCTSL